MVNKYYLDSEDTKKLTVEQLRAAKYNNYFLMSVFTNLVAEKGTNSETVVNSSFLPGLLLNNLPRKDSQTGIDSHNLGAKLNFLLRTLRNNPEAQKNFSSSFLSQLIECFRRGTTAIEDGQWIDYKESSHCEERYKNKDPFSAALLCYSRNDSLPVGINFAKIIDCLITTNNKGEYKLRDDFDKLSKEAAEMTAACDKYLNAIKTNPSFTRNFYQDPENSASI